MLGFKQFLIESLDDGYESYAASSKYKIPAGAVGKAAKKVAKDIGDYTSEVGQGIAADPVWFAKEWSKSFFSDPDTYHSGLAAAGLIPGTGEFADAADAGLYAATGDKEGFKLSVASMIPAAGILPGLARTARTSEKILGKTARNVTDTLQSQARSWQNSPEGLGKLSTSFRDPFYRQTILGIENPNKNQIEDLESLGVIIPDVNNPKATLSWKEILQGVYGKDAEKYASLATRGQERLKDPSFDPNNITSYVFPSYSKTALEMPIDIHLGTNTAVSKSKTTQQYSPFMPPGIAASYSTASRGRDLGDQVTLPINFNISADTRNLTPSALAHEAGHGIASTDPRFKFGEIVTQAHKSENPSKEILDKSTIEFNTRGPLRPVFGDSVPRTNISGIETELYSLDRGWKVPPGTASEIATANSPADLTPKTLSTLQTANRERGFVDVTDPSTFYDVQRKVRQSAQDSSTSWMNYMSNRELPSQIGDAKAWMHSKGYPHVDVNMPAEEAARLSKEIIEKWKKGFFPELGGGTIQIIDMLGNPKGKAFWDTIAKKNKGSDVSDKLKNIQMA